MTNSAADADAPVRGRALFAAEMCERIARDLRGAAVLADKGAAEDTLKGAGKMMRDLALSLDEVWPSSGATKK